MSFLNLYKSIPTGGRIKIEGGQTQGAVARTNEKISVNKYTPALGKGSEYAAKIKEEEDKAYYETVMNSARGMDAVRKDVTRDGDEEDMTPHSQMFELEDLTSIGTMPNLRELDREELTQVYEYYTTKPAELPSHLLPIQNESETITRLIETNQVCIIKGPTGCGKSTQIPQFILDTYIRKRAHCNIIVTQPRRIAAITISQHVCEQRGWQVGQLVGYQVALDKVAGDHTRLLYCTTGVLLEKLINQKEMTNYTHIILDEVHEREVDMDFAMLIIKDFLRSNSPHVKVVLMSATMDVTRFAKYFEVILPTRTLQPAPYYEIKREMNFNVITCYLENLANIGELPQIDVDDPSISQRAYDLVPKMLLAFNAIDDKDLSIGRSTEERGAVLIFLPGLQQIEHMHDLLLKADQSNPKVYNFWLCPLHSSISRQEQERVTEYAAPGKRKVILSTNIAESSLTIPDIKYVIDFCLTKHLVSDPVTGYSSLQLAWASHVNCKQRQGRAGRVQEGRVYRMVPSDFYQRQMKEDCVPEMQRSPLEVVVLKCKKLVDTKCPIRLLSTALDPPNLSNYEKTILKLKEIGALLTTCRGEMDPLDGDLTFIGQVMSSLPLDIHITKLILLGHVFDVLEEAIIMGCSMAVRNIFKEPFQQRLQAYSNKLLWADSSESDSVAYLNTYRVWRQMKGLGKFERSRGTEESWARRYMVEIKHLREVARLEDEVKKRLKNFNIQVFRGSNECIWSEEEKPLILKLVLAGAFYPNFYSRKPQNLNVEYEAVKMLGGKDPTKCVYLSNMPHPAPLYLDQVKALLRKQGVSEDVSLYHDGSRKLVVEFNSKDSNVDQLIGVRNFCMSIPGNIKMPVYRAVKLRQLNLPLRVRTYPEDKIKEEMNRLSLRSRNSTMSLAQSTSESNPVISLTQEHITINVIHVENAGHFYAHTDKLQCDVEFVTRVLNSPHALAPVSGEIVDNMIYAAPFRVNNHVFYYRATVKNRSVINDQAWLQVYYVDYGNSNRILARELMELLNERDQEELNKIPPCALECELAMVAPSVWTVHGGKWTEEATKYVCQTLLDRQWIANVYSYVNGVASLFVYIEDNPRPSQKEPLTLNRDLIKRGFATQKEEGYLSKLNHAKREEVRNMDVVSSKSSVYDDCSEMSLSSSIKDISFYQATSSRKPEVDLKGPNSPLEMKLYSLVHSSTNRDVRVEWNSVNSVLLDSDPSDPHERILVAGSVSQSADGRKLTLNHTTVLPNMHGLAALICLMFAPKIELRADENYSRYIGALCGLGCDKDNNSLFPENDLETTFDVQFTDNDIESINKLRFWMNKRFCGHDADAMFEGEIIKIQKSIRTFAYNLLKKVRPSMKVRYNHYSHQWGLISNCLQEKPFKVGDDYFESFIYKLHWGIKLQPENDRREIEELIHKLLKVNEQLKSGGSVDRKLLCCELCEVHFEYWKHLELHITSNAHHRDLLDWLKSRAEEHKITDLKWQELFN